MLVVFRRDPESHVAEMRNFLESDRMTLLIVNVQVHGTQDATAARLSLLRRKRWDKHIHYPTSDYMISTMRPELYLAPHLDGG